MHVTMETLPLTTLFDNVGRAMIKIGRRPTSMWSNLKLGNIAKAAHEINMKCLRIEPVSFVLVIVESIARVQYLTKLEGLRQ